MAELLSALVPTLIEKAADSLVTQVGFMRGIEARGEKLHDLLLAINDVITDAEEQASKRPSVKSWITRLKSAALDADDALDELQYEALRKDAHRRGHRVNSGVSSFFSPHRNPLLFKFKMGKRLQQIVGRINDLVVEMNQFGFVKDRPAPVAERMQTHSYVEEDGVVGRNEDRERIVHMLLHADSQKLSIIPIFGLGGMGKTTLAQLIFNDGRVQEQFDKPLWVCVSDDFNVASLVKKIIDLLTGKHCELKNDNMELLRQHLRENLGAKKYLLVLDDVWNEDEEKWHALRTLLLSSGAAGSALLVTTRNEKIASFMGTVDGYRLERLSPEDSWTLFRRRAFGTCRAEASELVQIGKKIVEKCHGVPLAVKSMGGLMSTKHEVKDWSAILESEAWDASVHDNQILPALRLSYDHLPSYMKQCFTFCAVFPKDYEIDKEFLIHLWISNGFIPSEGTFDLEAIGNHVFQVLVWRSFFQDVKLKKTSHWQRWLTEDRMYCGVTTFKIHDLMHDLAQHVGGGECVSLETSTKINELPNNVQLRHLAFAGHPKVGEVSHLIHHYRCIRSKIFSGGMSNGQGLSSHLRLWLVSNSYLRVLDLRRIRTRTLSIEPTFMKHMRYIDLSDSQIEVIPEALSALYNLQVLVLTGCCRLTQLPKDMKYMTSLRHVYLDYCSSLNLMPAGLGQLINLQTLTKFIVGNDSGCGIKELKDLKLGGRLGIHGLNKITNRSDAEEAKLGAKHNLEQLLLYWGNLEDTTGSQAYLAEEVLDALKPHKGLKVLKIRQYEGTKFPMWMIDRVMLRTLVELELIHCQRCTNIPPVWQLPFLESLTLRGMNSLTYLCGNYLLDKQGSDHPSTMFPKLKRLSLSWMGLLDRWHEGDVGEVTSVTFPELDAMNIAGCPKLTTLPNALMLKSLRTESNVLLRSATSPPALLFSHLHPSASQRSNNRKENILAKHLLSWASLTSLGLTGFDCLVPLEEEQGSYDHTNSIHKLRLNSCDCFIQSDERQQSLWFWKLFANLECLQLRDCGNLTFWPEEEFRSLTCLKWLEIFHCKNFTGLLPTPISQKPFAEDGLRNLKSLRIQHCPRLMVFPTCFTYLETIDISGSDQLESLPEGLGSQGNIQYLSVFSCASLQSLPVSIQCLANLRSLRLNSCNSLTMLPEGMQKLTALRSLYIEECAGIKSFPQGLQQRLHSLTELTIINCPTLGRRCKRGGEYWDKISAIRYLDVEHEQRSFWGLLLEIVLLLTCTSDWYGRPSSG